MLNKCKNCGTIRTRTRRGRLVCKPCIGARLKDRRERCREKRICPTCGKTSVADTNHVYCESCRIRKRLNSQKARREKSPFACRKCGTDLPTISPKHCEQCLAGFRASNARTRQRGLCLYCGIRAAIPPFKQCDRCRNKRQARRKALVASGLCGYGGACPNPPAVGKMWCEFHSKRQIIRISAKRRKERESVIAAYGGACACCGESTYEFLAIDHVNGNGKGEGGPPLVRKVIEEGFPAAYRMLCHNCNMARGLYGQCPHEQEILRLTKGQIA